MTDVDVKELARELAARIAVDALLDALDIAALLKCSSRYVTEGYALTPGFPKPIRLVGPGGRRSHPRWRRSDVIDWINSHDLSQRPRVGRPRKRP